MNGMRYKLGIIAAFAGALITVTNLTSCNGETSTGMSPRMLSSTPDNGASGIEPGDIEIRMVFDDSLSLAPTGFAKVSIDGATVTRVSPVGDVLTVYLSQVQRGESYTLNVGQGTVLGSTGIENDPVAISFSTLPAPGATTVDPGLCTPDPIESARKVYGLMRDVYGKAILSSTMANVSWNINEAELVNKEIGDYPAITFFDYIHLNYSPAGWIDYNKTDVVENWWNAGGIPGSCWHWRVPKNENDVNPDNFTYSPGETTFRPENIFVDGSWERKIADADLSEMADYLLALQEKGIPMIWRPMHEAAGNIYKGGSAWFWWGIDGAETYVRLWRYMFDFFKKKGVRNLIWVWTTEMDDSPFYPGDEYVDIVGRDLYNITDPREAAAEYETILKEYPNKMIALSECGAVAPISRQWAEGARWIFFMPWYQHDATTLAGHGSADDVWWKDAFSFDWVLRRGNLKFK